MENFEIQTLLMRHGYLATVEKHKDFAVFTMPGTYSRENIQYYYYIDSETNKLIRESQNKTIDVDTERYIYRPTVLIDIYRICKNVGYDYKLVSFLNNKILTIPIKNPEDILPAPLTKEDKEKENVLLNLINRLVDGQFRGNV